MGLLKELFISWANIDDVMKNIVKIKKELNVQKTEIEELKKLVKKLKGDSAQNITPDSDENIDTGMETVLNSESSKPISAKEAFINNINLILPLLENVTSDHYDASKWEELIKSLNSNDLICTWEKIKNNQNSVLRILAYWGFKPDLCTSFVCSSHELSMYVAENDEPLVVGNRYDVISKCWLYTDCENNKRIILKGIVRKAG